MKHLLKTLLCFLLSLLFLVALKETMNPQQLRWRDRSNLEALVNRSADGDLGPRSLHILTTKDGLQLEFGDFTKTIPGT